MGWIARSWKDLRVSKESILTAAQQPFAKTCGICPQWDFLLIRIPSVLLHHTAPDSLFLLQASLAASDLQRAVTILCLSMKNRLASSGVFAFQVIE